MVRELLALLGLAAATVDPRTISDAWPPERYTTDTAVRVLFVTSQEELDAICGPSPVSGRTKSGCTGHDAFGPLIVVPHPGRIGAKDADAFRLIVAHELAHVNGWPGTHDK
jgi:hypothetical protein